MKGHSKAANERQFVKRLSACCGVPRHARANSAKRKPEVKKKLGDEEVFSNMTSQNDLLRAPTR